MMSNKRFLAVMLVVASAVSSAYAQFSGPAPLAWRWQQSVTDAPSGSPVVSDDPAQQNVVYVASGQRVYALNRNDGNQKWRYPSGEPLASNFKGTPLLINGMVIAAAANNTIYAINQATGELKWSYLAQSPVVGTLVSNDKILAFSLGDRSIMALNLADGTPFYANSDGSANPLNIIDGITGKLSIWNDDVLVISGGRTLYSINIATRKTVWKVAFDDLGPDVKPAVTKTGIYLNSGTFLIGLSAGTGFTEFQKDTGTPLAFSPTVYGVNIGVVSKDGKFFEYDQLGHQVLKNPIDLGSDPFTAPTALPNGLFVVPTSNGSINLIDPKQGVIWDYPVRPIGGVQDAPESTKRGGAGGKGGFGGAGGGLSGGGLGGGLGGDSSSFGGGQGGLGGGVNGQQRKKKIVTIQAAGPAIIAGNTLLLLGRDGSLLAFDKDLGVDLTAPTVKMTFPNPGDQVNPGAPLELVFQIEDEASGVKTSSLKVSVDGKPLEYVLTPEGFAVVKFSLEGKNKPMRDGRHKIVVEVSDWMGNVRHEEFILTADSTLAPVILPGTETKNGKGGLGGLGGKGGGLGGGGLGGGQGSNE